MSELFMGMSSCDFVGDFGCTDPECWRCHSILSPAHLRVLAANLAAAGMLCTAWQQRDVDPSWKPGCHRSIVGALNKKGS